MVIDFHVHMFPDAMAQKTINTLAEKAKLPAYSDGSVSMTLTKMQATGVTLAVHQNIATNPRQMKKVNDFAIFTNQLESFISFGSVHPDAPDLKEKILCKNAKNLLGL